MVNKTSRDVALVMNSKADATGVTWVKFEKIGRSENPSSSRARTQRALLPHAEGGPTGNQTQLLSGYDSHRITILVRLLIFL